MGKFLSQQDFTNIPLLNVVLQQLASDPTDVTAKIYYNTTSDVVRFFNGTTWENVGGDGTTNITVVEAATNVEIQSSTGTNDTIALANGTLAGVSENNLTDAEKTVLGNTSGSNSGDQTSIVGITGSTAEFNTALNDGSFATGGGTATGTNTGDEPSASTTAEGVVELAIASEVDTGTDNVRAITPLALAGSALQTKVDAITGTNTGDEVQATTTTQGIIELATQGEVDTGSDTDRAVTPATLSTYVAAQITAGMDFKGDYNASTNSPDLDTSPSGVKIGDTYAVTVNGTFFTEALEIGDIIIAKQDDPTLLSHWSRVQYNLTAATIKTQYESNADTNALTDAYVTLLGNTSGSNSGDMTDADVKTAYENNADTNALTDAYVTLLGNTSGSNSGDEANASTTVAGIVEEATQTEVNNGTAAGAQARLFVTPATLQSNLGVSATLNNVVVYETTIGNGSLTDFTITHNIGRQFVKATVIRNSAPYDEVGVDVECDSTTACGITGFVVAPTTDEFKVIVMG